LLAKKCSWLAAKNALTLDKNVHGITFFMKALAKVSGFFTVYFGQDCSSRLAFSVVTEINQVELDL
jgi:hypothetical protein